MSIKPLEFEKPIAELEAEIQKLKVKSSSQKIDMSQQISSMEATLQEIRNDIYNNENGCNDTNIC